MRYRINMNGRLVPLAKASISVLDSAYLYGEGVFETLTSHQGKVLFFELHLKRLRRTSQQLGIPLPLKMTRLKQEVYRTLKANRLHEAMIRIELSKREKTFGARGGRPAGSHWVIFVKPYEPYAKKLYQKGARTVLVRSYQNDPFPLSGLKSTNYLSKILGRREAWRRKADEGVLLNAAGRITEGAGSSLFIVHRGLLLTPPLTEGLIPSITRAVILQLAGKMNIPYREKKLTVADVKKADEIFLASTLKRVLPVGNFEGIKKKAPGPVTSRLIAAYESSW